jgi:membrane fusion protein (multidrug efflux system)
MASLTQDDAAARMAEPAQEHIDGPTRTRRRGFAVLAALLLAGGAGYWAYETWFTGASEWTDDAYVAGDVVTVTARESGTVLAIHADNTEAVKKGAALIDLDPATADVAMAAAQADLARSLRSVRADFAQVDSAEADIEQARAALVRAQDDVARRIAAENAGAVSGEELAHAQDTVRTAKATLDSAQGRQAQALAAVSGTRVDNNPMVMAAEAALRRAAIVQSHMRLIAPVDGTIAQRTVQVGQQVTPGMPLMAVVPLERAWIDANYRETQLADLRVGQPATVETDIYGDKVVFHGHVLGLGAGSGNAFALLPPQNASGNWIKIVQRLPVRIGLDPRELRAHPLQIGLSVKVTVDTHDHSGPPLSRGGARLPDSQPSQDGGAQVDQLIRRIVAQNSGE